MHPINLFHKRKVAGDSPLCASLLSPSLRKRSGRRLAGLLNKIRGTIADSPVFFRSQTAYLFFLAAFFAGFLAAFLAAFFFVAIV